MEDIRLAVAHACERLIWIVINNDLERPVRLEINSIVEELKDAISSK